MKIDKDGVSILAISEAAESFGFRTQVVKLNIEAVFFGQIDPVYSV